VRRLALALLCALAACPAGKLEGGRYACDPNGDRSDNSAQCPGAWRCGLEGICHETGDTTVAWRCDGGADCEASWQCGIAPSRQFRECHDPAVGAPWPCDEAGDCSAGWQCGIAASRQFRECHDPAVGAAWPCNAGADCSAGWSCGLTRDGDAGECHDPGAPAAFTCTNDSHCLGGWRCGLTRTRMGRECHDPASPSDWPCDGDFDCVGMWRCSAQGTCADPRDDALFATAQLDASTALVSPLSASPYDAVSISPRNMGADGHSKQLLAGLRDSRLELLAIDVETRALSTWRVPDPGYERFIAHGTQTLTDTPMAIIPDERPRVVGVFADGGLAVLTFESDGGFGSDVLVNEFAELPEFTATRFKHCSGGTRDVPAAVLAFDRDITTYFGRIWGPNQWVDSAIYVDDPSFRFTDVPGNYVRDLAGIRPNDWECIFLSEARGLWVSQRNDSFGFEPLDSPALPNLACQPGAPHPNVNRLATFGTGWLAIEQAPDGGDAQLTLLDVRALTERSSPGGLYHCTSFLGDPCAVDDKLPFTIELGPCAPCPGARLADFAVVAAPGGPPELEARCTVGDGGSSAFFRLAHRTAGSPICDRRLLLGASGLFATPGLRAPPAPVPGAVTWWSPGGQIWFGPETREASPLVFDRAAIGLLEIRGGLVAMAEDVVGLAAPGVGLTSSPFAGLQAPVRHRQSWALRSGNVVDLAGSAVLGDAPIVAILSTPMANPSGPFSAAQVRAQTVRALVVATGTQVWAADVERYLAGSEPYVVLAPRLVLPNPVQSLALPEQAPAGATSWLEGWVVLGGRVQRLIAETASRWRAEDVPLPASQVPHEVWFDRGRARVGLDDGVVLGLPSRVQLAPPLPLGAVDYETTCGEQLALSTDGLYRLAVAAGAPAGTWEKLPLPPGFAALEGGRVHALGADVYVFTRTGDVARVTLGGASCP